MNFDLMRRELAAMKDIPEHKRNDAEFLRGVIAIGTSGFREALVGALDLQERLHQSERGHENSIRAIGRLLRLCDESGIGDKAREELEMTD